MECRDGPRRQPARLSCPRAGGAQAEGGGLAAATELVQIGLDYLARTNPAFYKAMRDSTIEHYLRA